MILAVFKSALPSMQYLFKDGMSAIFVGGKCLVSKEAHVKELMEEVGQVGQHKSSHPYIYVDESEQEIDTEALTPLEIIKLQAKEEARQELLAEQAAERARALDAKFNTSSSKSEDFATSLGNSNTIAQAGAAESTGDNASVLATTTEFKPATGKIVAGSKS